MKEIHSKKDKQPLVSFSCLSYNHKDFIAQSIESFLTQITSFVFFAKSALLKQTYCTKNIIPFIASNH